MPLFKEGDVVILKSGGPKMTIKYCDDRQVICNWFENNTKNEDNFLPTQLEIYIQWVPTRGKENKKNRY